MTFAYTLRGPTSEIVCDELSLKIIVAELRGEEGPYVLQGTCRVCNGTGAIRGYCCPRCVMGRSTETFDTPDALRISVNPAAMLHVLGGLLRTAGFSACLVAGRLLVSAHAEVFTVEAQGNVYWIRQLCTPRRCTCETAADAVTALQNWK